MIVGAGIAGVSASEQLRAFGYQGKLTIIGAEPRLPYDRPPLSKDFLVGTETQADLLLKSESWYADNEIELRLGVTVDAIRADEGRVTLSAGGQEPADAVLVATGGRPRTLSLRDADHPAITTLRTLDDAESLRARLVPGARVGVVGAGLIGAEVAATAVARGCEVALVDPSPRPLERVVGPDIASLLHAQHRHHGVRLVDGALTAVRVDAAGVRLLVRGGAEAIDCDTVVVGIGIEPEVSLAIEAGLETSGGILVDVSQRTSHPNVFAAGDVARTVVPGGSGGLLPRSEHWDAAVHESRTAAAALMGRPVPAPRTPWFWSDRYGTHLEVLGQFLAGDTTVVRGTLGGETFAVLAIHDGRCVGAVAVNRSSEMNAVRRLIERRIPVRAEQLADESVRLASLVRG